MPRPPCFNRAHHHAAPEEASEAVPQFFKAIWDASQAVRPGALVEICPCGTGYSFFTMPYLNMTVASDPESSWQVRLKGKTIKALLGDRVAYFGDHVEMSEGGTDFASTFGVGGVIGTNFALARGPGQEGSEAAVDAGARGAMGPVDGAATGNCGSSTANTSARSTTSVSTGPRPTSSPRATRVTTLSTRRSSRARSSCADSSRVAIACATTSTTATSAK